MEVMKSYSQGDRFLKMIRRTDPMILESSLFAEVQPDFAV